MKLNQIQQVKDIINRIAICESHIKTLRNLRRYGAIDITGDKMSTIGSQLYCHYKCTNHNTIKKLLSMLVGEEQDKLNKLEKQYEEMGED